MSEPETLRTCVYRCLKEIQLRGQWCQDPRSTTELVGVGQLIRVGPVKEWSGECYHNVWLDLDVEPRLPTAADAQYDHTWYYSISAQELSEHFVLDSGS